MNDDPAAQTRQIFLNMKAILDAAGDGFGDVVKVTVYLAEVADRKKINPARQEFFGNARPAGTLIGVKPLASNVERRCVDVVRALRARERSFEAAHRRVVAVNHR